MKNIMVIINGTPPKSRTRIFWTKTRRDKPLHKRGKLLVVRVGIEPTLSCDPSYQDGDYTDHPTYYFICGSRKNRTSYHCGLSGLQPLAHHWALLPSFVYSLQLIVNLAENKRIELLLLFTQVCLANRYDKPIFVYFPSCEEEGLEP
mgnify:CR=1 FL=1